MYCEPTVAEVVFWIIMAIPLIVILLTKLIGINFDYDPKANDPYRYCPKEEEE